MVRHAIPLAFCALLADPLLAVDPPDITFGDAQLAASLRRAMKAHSEAIRAADEKLLTAMTVEEKRINSLARLKVEEKIRYTELVKEQRAAFEESGKLPDFRSLAAAVKTFKLQKQAADANCERVFDAEAERYNPINAKVAKSILELKRSFLEVEPKDTRTYWKIAGVNEGWFIMTRPGVWVEYHADGKPFSNWVEVARTPNHIDLKDLQRGYNTRLLNDRWLLQTDPKGTLDLFLKGQWQEPPGGR